MTNINYEKAKGTLEIKLKETRNEIRRLQTKLNKLCAENPAVIRDKKHIEEDNAKIAGHKAKFVQYCQGYFSKMFLNEEFLKTSEYDAIKGFPFSDELAEIVWREAVDMEIRWGFENATKEFIKNYRTFDYDNYIKILNNKELIESLNLRSKTSQIHDLLEEITLTIEECEDSDIDWTKKLQKAKRKRNNFFARFRNLNKINREIENIEKNFNDNKDMLNGLLILKASLERTGYSFEELLGNYKKNPDYQQVEFLSKIVKSYEKDLEVQRERIAYNSGIEEQIDNLRSKETKMNLLKESFNSDVIKNLAKDPAFLINLGKESVISSKNSLDGKINKHLVEKYVSEGMEQ